MKSFSKIKPAAMAATLLVAGSTANAAINVNFHDDGADVTVTFDGTLALNPAFANDSGATALTFGRIDGANNVLLSLGTGFFVSSNLGSSASVFSSPNTTTNTATDIKGNFGFSDTSIFWGSAEISGGSNGAVSELTVSAANNSLIFRGVGLDDLNLDGLAQNTVLWTSYSSVTAAGTSGSPALPGDTITFTSSSVATVPEPSSLLLCSLGGLGLLTARRRR